MNLGTGIIGGAAFPRIRGTSTSSGSNAGFFGSVPIAMPNDVVAGELLIVIVASSGSLSSIGSWSTITNTTINAPLAAYYKIAAGGGADSFSGTMGPSGGWAGVSFRISGYSGTPEGSSLFSSGTSADPPSLTPSWGTKKTLWLAGAGAIKQTSGAAAITSYPSGWSGGQQATGVLSSTQSTVCGTANLESETASVDPGVFGLNASLLWSALTVAVKP
jgi:hypothetical protein